MGAEQFDWRIMPTLKILIMLMVMANANADTNFASDFDANVYATDYNNNRGHQRSI